MLIVVITFIIVIAIYVYTIAVLLKEEHQQVILFDNEDDAFATILSQIFRSKNETELRKLINLILAYDDQFNNENDLDYFIHIWDKRMNDFSKTKTTI
jgi:ABC-type transport system involved in multi-copper enzyme maturation permease subunit